MGYTKWRVLAFSAFNCENNFSMGPMMVINFSNSPISWREKVMPQFISMLSLTRGSSGRLAASKKTVSITVSVHLKSYN